MTFNSIEYLIFFPLVALAYFSIPYRFRWMLLLAASYYFYMCWRIEYIILIIASTLVDYFAGLKMAEQPDRKGRRKYLIFSLVFNLGLLFAFKYFNFFNDSIRQIFNQYNVFYNVPYFYVFLPVGISFYTFQTLSYTIEVYRGNKKPERHLGIFALYVSFFPQLVAGPIERAQNLLPQFLEKHDFDYERVTSGMRLMLWGMFKKVVIADRLSLLVDKVFAMPENYHGRSFVVATIFFAFQIYCDFSGYSDLAIGAARILGFRLMENFKRPYFARSISDFWSRWHISLSTWFRDYLYIPLGGSRVKGQRWLFNIMITFVLSGLWHGANWTFMVWGALHGFYYLLEKAVAKWGRPGRNGAWHKMVPGTLKVFATFCLVNFAWIFFRADNLSDAFYIVSHLFQDMHKPLDFSRNSLGMRQPEFYLAIGLIIFLISVQYFQKRGGSLARLSKWPVWIRWPVYITISLVIMNLGITQRIPFIYFQF